MIQDVHPEVLFLFNIWLLFCDRQDEPSSEYLRNKKTCTVFLSSYGNTSGIFGELEMRWEHDPQANVSVQLF